MHRYASNNQKLCWAAVAAIETGNAAALGSVMNDAQQVALQAAAVHATKPSVIPSLFVLPVVSRSPHAYMQAFNQCAIENCREQLLAPRLREVMASPALRRSSFSLSPTSLSHLSLTL